jgi:hypothetical protein
MDHRTGTKIRDVQGVKKQRQECLAVHRRDTGGDVKDEVDVLRQETGHHFLKRAFNVKKHHFISGFSQGLLDKGERLSLEFLLGCVVFLFFLREHSLVVSQKYLRYRQ